MARPGGFGSRGFGYSPGSARPVRLIVSCLSSWLLFHLTALPHLGAQTTTDLTDLTEGCDQCAIDRFVSTTLGETSDPNGLVYGFPVHLTELHDGSLVLLTTTGGPPTVFNPTGTFQRRIGKRGRGPREFVRPAHVLEVPGDSLLILDAGQGRATVIHSTGTQRVVSGIPSVRSIDILHWPIVISVGDIRSPERIGRSFHLLDLSSDRATVRRSLGRESIPFLPNQPPDGWSVVAVSDSVFWTIGGPRYTLQLWNTRDRENAGLRRRMDGFGPEAERIGVGTPERPPSPQVIDSFSDGEGLIWIVLLVPPRRLAKRLEGGSSRPARRVQHLEIPRFSPGSLPNARRRRRPDQRCPDRNGGVSRLPVSLGSARYEGRDVQSRGKRSADRGHLVAHLGRSK